MKALLTLLAICFTLTASAAQRITLTLTVTNASNCTNGTVLTVNGVGRMATNITYTSTTFQTNSTAASLKTNLFRQIAANPIGTPALALVDVDATSFKLVGGVGKSLTVSSTPNWASFELGTNAVLPSMGLRLPLSNEQETNAQLLASGLVSGINDYATNAFTQTAPALSGYVSLHQSQTLSNKTLIAPNVSGGFLTNSTNIWAKGSGSNQVQHSLVMTNARNFGNPFSSPGIGVESEQFGIDSVASGELSIAVRGRATAWRAIAIGGDATGESSTSVGVDSSATALNAIAYGTDAQATESNTVALGRFARAYHPGSVAIGENAATTDTNQIRLGSIAHTVVASILAPSVITNATYAGSNQVSGVWRETIASISTLANGVNPLDPGAATYIELSGPTAAYSIDRISGIADGRKLVIRNKCAAVLTLAHESNAAGGSASERIKTFDGANTTVTTNGWVHLIYVPSDSRWSIVYKYP